MKLVAQRFAWFAAALQLVSYCSFESGFPHGHDQWISAAATNWATMALVAAIDAIR